MTFLVALRFLTSIPFPWAREATPRELGGAVVWFPVVGLLLGLVIGGVDQGLFRLFSVEVASALVLAGLVLLTGALHLDGLMDTCDGLAGGSTPEERLAIMRDSRVGAVGVVGAMVVLLVKYAALTSLMTPNRLGALVLMPVVGRWAMVYGIYAHPYARRTGGLGAAFKPHTNWKVLLWAFILTLVVAFGALRWVGLAAILVVMAAVALAAAYLSRQLSGLTGDAYGALGEVAEAGVLVAVPAAALVGEVLRWWNP